MKEIIHFLSWTGLWFVGLITIPFLMSLVWIIIRSRDSSLDVSDEAKVVFAATVLIYVVVTFIVGITI